jgi:hypothetical protein
MMLVGLLIPLGVGVLATMELRASVRTAAVAVQPAAETTTGTSDSHVALATADPIETAAAGSETPAQPALVEEQPAPVDAGASSEGISVGSSEPPSVIVRQRHNSKSKNAAAARPKKVIATYRPQSKRKIAIITRTTASVRRKAASNTESCRLSAFGGLRKALNSADCEI